MTAVVSDTSPFNYLILIGAVDLLPRLFSEVYIPKAVVAELTHSRTPALVRGWIGAPPHWLRVRDPLTTEHGFDLDEGEAHAILLAKELGIVSILIDERKGFRTAKMLGLEPIGLLGVLETSARNGWISFDHYVELLRATSFRFHEELIREANMRLLRTRP